MTRMEMILDARIEALSQKMRRIEEDVRMMRNIMKSDLDTKEQIKRVLAEALDEHVRERKTSHVPVDGVKVIPLRGGLVRPPWKSELDPLQNPNEPAK